MTFLSFLQFLDETRLLSLLLSSVQITPTQFLETVNAINVLLISAHSLGYAFVDNALAYFTLQISRAVKKSHYEKASHRASWLMRGKSKSAYTHWVTRRWTD